MMDQLLARNILKEDFIGIDELVRIARNIGLCKRLLESSPVPRIPFSANLLKKAKGRYILLLMFPFSVDGSLITVNSLRKKFGVGGKKGPFFYNQDWYLCEPFANKGTRKAQWLLVRKQLIPASRARQPKRWADKSLLPSALACAYTFFVYWFHSKGKCLWEHDYLWCSDLDHNGDRVYVGRYVDPAGINRDGFEIHRHLSIKDNYGVVDIF